MQGTDNLHFCFSCVPPEYIFTVTLPCNLAQEARNASRLEEGRLVEDVEQNLHCSSP